MSHRALFFTIQSILTDSTPIDTPSTAPLFSWMTGAASKETEEEPYVVRVDTFATHSAPPAVCT